MLHMPKYKKNSSQQLWRYVKTEFFFLNLV